jgi:type IV pilus assembly protein PilX
MKTGVGPIQPPRNPVRARSRLPGRRPVGPRSHRGVALFISLVLLLILTIIGVSAVQTTTLETRMARNEHDALLAFQAAESALRDAEAFLETVVSTAAFTETGTNGLWRMPGFGETERWQRADIWTDAGGSRPAPTNPGNMIAKRPRYLIEHLASVLREQNAYQLNDPYAGGAGADRIEVFRITARGIGGSPNAQVILQSTYGRILD